MLYAAESVFVCDGTVTMCFLFRPGSNRGPSACEADVITTTLRKHNWEEAAQSSTSMWYSDYGVVILLLMGNLLVISLITNRLHRF